MLGVLVQVASRPKLQETPRQTGPFQSQTWRRGRGGAFTGGRGPPGGARADLPALDRVYDPSERGGGLWDGPRAPSGCDRERE